MAEQGSGATTALMGAAGGCGMVGIGVFGAVLGFVLGILIGVPMGDASGRKAAAVDTAVYMKKTECACTYSKASKAMWRSDCLVTKMGDEVFP